MDNLYNVPSICNTWHIKYLNKPEKVIKIHSENNKNNVVLVIEDNGEGILDHDLPRVFEYGFTGADRQK